MDKLREFNYLAKIVFKITLLNKNENSQILNFVKSLKIINSRKFKHAKITRSNESADRQLGIYISTIYNIYKISLLEISNNEHY